MKYQSDLKPIFDVIQEYSKNLIWLVAAHDFKYLNNNLIDEKLNPKQDFIKITGKDLVEIVKHNDLQFKWGVLSGCESIPDINNIDYNKWNLKNYSTEGYVYEDAEIEIDCYNGIHTIIRTENKEVIEKLSEYFMCKINA